MAFQSGGGGVGVDEGESGWLMQAWSIASAAGSRGETRTVERGRWEGHRLACPKFQPHRGVSASFAEAGGVMGAGRREGESALGLGQAGG